MSRASELRDEFDRSFAVAPAGDTSTPYELLQIELAGEPYALALSEIRSLHVDLAIVPVPSRAPALLGVIALRGAIVPVYDLRRLLGLPTDRPSRWVVVAGNNAFAFDHVAGHFSAAELPAGRMIHHEGRAHPLVDFEVALKGALHG